MSKSGFGRSMGRDWGGRRKANPANAPKVTYQQVIDFAASHGFEVKRDGNSSWFVKKNDTWYTCGMTNFLAITHLTMLAADLPKAAQNSENRNESAGG